jgi:hypothetical protein
MPVSSLQPTALGIVSLGGLAARVITTASVWISNGEHVPAAGHILALRTRAGLHGGKFVLTAQRGRQQARVEVVPLR